MFSFISLRQKHCCQNEENPPSRWRCFWPHAWRSPYYVLLIRGHPHHVRTFRLEVPLLPLHISRCALRSTVVGSQNPGHLQSGNRGRTWIDSPPPKRERVFLLLLLLFFFSLGRDYGEEVLGVHRFYSGVSLHRPLCCSELGPVSGTRGLYHEECHQKRRWISWFLLRHCPRWI